MSTTIRHMTSEFLKSYYGLLPDNRVRGMTDHLDGCAECKTEFAGFKRGMEMLKTHPFEAPSAALDSRILASIREKRKSAPSFFSRFRTPIFAGGFASLLIIIALGVFLIPSRPDVGQLALNGTVISVKSGEMISVPSGGNAVLEQSGIFRAEFTGGSAFSTKNRNDRTCFSLQNGQGDFSVVKRGEEFRVSTFNADIRVTGTFFSVNANKGESITSISVAEGRVEVTGRSGKMLVLQAGDVCEVSKNDEPRLIVGRPDLKTGLKTDSAVFDNAQEKIYLRDGSVLVGHTIKQTESEIVFETSEGRITVHPQDIERTEFVR